METTHYHNCSDNEAIMILCD